MGFNQILLLSFISLLAFRVNAKIPFFYPFHHHSPPPPPHHPPPPPPPHHHHSHPPPPHHQSPPPAHHSPPPPAHHQSPPPPPHHSPPPPAYHQSPPPPHHAPPPPHYGFHMPKPEENGVKSIGVQGIIYCKENSTKLTPIKGAVARITCKACDKHGRVTGSYTVMSDYTNKSGYFLATMSLEDIKEVGNVTDCKAYLYESSSPACSLPTNVNKGFTGASFRGPRLLRNKMHLYTVGPFEYVRFMPIGD